MSPINADLKRQIVAIVKKWVRAPHYKVFVFGSRANGTGTERSDLDIGIEAAPAIAAQTLQEIRSEINELPFLEKIDLVNFGDVSEDFKEIAKKRLRYFMKSKFDNLLEQLGKANLRFQDVMRQEKNEFIRDSAIQRFEFTFELAWKTIKAYLEEKRGARELFFSKGYFARRVPGRID